MENESEIKEESLISRVKAGDMVTIVTPQGSRLTGRAVMRTSNRKGWVLNLGGPHGTPGLAYDRNTIKVSKAKTKRMEG